MRSLGARIITALAAAALLGGLAGCHRASPTAPAQPGAATDGQERQTSASRHDVVAGLAGTTGPGGPTPGAGSGGTAGRESSGADAASHTRATASDAAARGAASPAAAGGSGSDIARAPNSPQAGSTAETKAMGAPAQASAAAFASAAPDRVDDASITRQVAAAIAADQELRRLKIDVDTQNGVVTLSGPAPTASAKARADEIARTVKGVVSVNNQLTLQTG